MNVWASQCLETTRPIRTTETNTGENLADLQDSPSKSVRLLRDFEYHRGMGCTNIRSSHPNKKETSGRCSLPMVIETSESQVGKCAVRK